MKRHQWKEKTEDGETRLVRVTQHGRKWRLQSRLKTEDEWTYFDVIPLEDLEELHEVLANKYQRGRVPHEQVLEIEAMLKSRRKK